jgi:hypothetical protein
MSTTRKLADRGRSKTNLAAIGAACLDALANPLRPQAADAREGGPGQGLPDIRRYQGDTLAIPGSVFPPEGGSDVRALG